MSSKKDMSSTKVAAAASESPKSAIKKVPKPNAILDWLVCSLIGTECIVIAYVLPNDLRLLLIGLLFVVAGAVWLTKAIFRSGGGYVSRSYLKHLGDPLRKEVTMKKFCDQSWQLTLHVAMTILELMVIQGEPWWSDTTTLWNPESPTCDFPDQKFLTKFLYMIQLAIWIYTAFSCKFLEEIRKDYLVMMTHHFVTIALVTWSYATQFMPIGVLVLLIHDASDIPLDMLKMANYLKLEARKGFFVSEGLFAISIVGWFYSRVYLFPTKLIYSAFWENREACCLPHQAHDLSILFPSPGPPSWLAFIVLLTTLFVLHVWWTFLLLRLLVGVLTTTVHDVAEDEYEGASDTDKEE
ncbi:Aste57867_4488 [Aphanomyces stellatus]|uniref:Aste57867_4488 protein n=1 Tax=Aphanomyces stellatus TaxID=120398 RepID=A0A485KCQ5_9STRA|nr:hypothetical protein As57867_004475 [Aphanomyces stellatus]VFT81598.1 Aste57867_4488 [Aphanomyces stellatus]